VAIWQVAVVAVVVGVCALIARRSLRSRMSTRHIQQLSAGLLTMQRRAFKNVKTVADGGPRLPNLEELQQNYFKTCQQFGIVYTIEHENGSYIHTISGKAPARPRKFVIQSMLVIMLELTRQFEETGFEPSELDMSESELGTHFIAFLLTPEQHERLAQVARVARPIAPSHVT